MSKLSKRIGKRVSQERRKKNLTTEKLAYENGISKGYLSDIENGKKLPSIKMLERIADALEVDISILFKPL
jgi:transcriptional regulator with XRE-family HTH domain